MIRAFVIRHSAWNDARVFLGDDAEQRARDYMYNLTVEQEADEAPTREEWDANWEEGIGMDNWDIAEDAILPLEELKIAGYNAPTIDGRKTLEQLSIDAAPVSVSGGFDTEETDDEGSERQMAAETQFFSAVKAVLSEGEWDGLMIFCQFAGAEDRIAEAMRLARKHS